MNTSNNSIGAALAAITSATQGAVSHANVKNPADKTGTTMKLTEAEKREKAAEARYIREQIATFAYFDGLPVNRREGLVEIGLACREEADRREEFAVAFAAGVVHLFPSATSIDWPTYSNAQRFVRYTFGQHASRVFREQMRLLCAHYDVAVPSAGTGSNTGNVKGLTPRKYVQGVTSSFNAAIEKALKGKQMRDKLDARTMAEVAEVCRVVRTMLSHLEKAVNE